MAVGDSSDAQQGPEDVFIEVSEEVVPKTVDLHPSVPQEEPEATLATDAVETASVVDSVASDVTVDLEEMEARASEPPPGNTLPVSSDDALAATADELPPTETDGASKMAPDSGSVVASDVVTPVQHGDTTSPIEITTVDSSSDSSSNSSSSSSDSSSDSSDSASDSDVEDVTAQYRDKSLENAPRGRTMSESEDEEEETEQWFQEHDLEVDGMAIVGVAQAKPTDDDVVDEFLLPEDPATRDMGPRSASKRCRPDYDSDVEENQVESAGEVTISSNEVDEYPSGDDYSYPKAHPKSSSTQRKRARGGSSAPYPPLQPLPPPKYSTVPTKFSIFQKIDPDDDSFPILKGQYKIRNDRNRAYFTGEWAFTEAKHAECDTSKFEYSSGNLQGRSDRGQRPFSGKYTGYFVLRQFHGARTRIKDDQIEFHFLPIASDSSDHESDDGRYKVLGEGKNRFGRFLVHGYLNAADGRMMVRRHYLE